MKLNLLNERIVAYSKGGSILLRVNYSRALIRFLGASCPASIQPGKDCVNSLTLFPAPEKPTLVALAVWNREKMPDDWTHAYLLEIIRQGDAPWINLGQAWIPPSDRPGQALEWGVEVKIGKTTFSTCNRDRQSPSSRFVEDGNLLCRFLIGDAKPEEVTAAAETLQEEMALLEQRSELRRQLDETIKAEQAWPAKYAALQQQFAEANGKLAQMEHQLGVKNREREISDRTSAKRIAELKGSITQMRNTANAAHFGNRKRSLQAITYQSYFDSPPIA